jgi:hypothetical protein
MTTKPEQQIHQCECAICRAGNDPVTTQYHQQVNLLLSRLNEPQRRWYAGVLSQQPDNLSDSQLAEITGLDEKTIRRGRRELIDGLGHLPPDRQRQAGGGRPRAEKKTRS